MAWIGQSGGRPMAPEDTPTPYNGQPVVINLPPKGNPVSTPATVETGTRPTPGQWATDKSPSPLHPASWAQSIEDPMGFASGVLGGLGGGPVSSPYNAQAYADIGRAQAAGIYGQAMQAAAAPSPLTGRPIIPSTVSSRIAAVPENIGGPAGAALRQQQLDAAAAGLNAPSAAQAQMAANLARIGRQQLSVAATARGADRAAARRDAMLGIGTQGMEAAATTAALAAEEEQRKRAAYQAALGGIRQGDVSGAGIETDVSRLAADIAKANQGAGLAAETANAANQIARYNATTGAQLGFLGAATQAAGAGTQASQVQAEYGGKQMEAQTKKDTGIIGGIAAGLGGIFSDDRTKDDVSRIGGDIAPDARYRLLGDQRLTLAPPTFPVPNAPPVIGENMLKYSIPKTKTEKTGLLGMDSKTTKVGETEVIPAGTGRNVVMTPYGQHYAGEPSSPYAANPFAPDNGQRDPFQSYYGGDPFQRYYGADPFESYVSDERAKADVARAAYLEGVQAGSGPRLETVTPETLDNRTPIWKGGDVDRYRLGETPVDRELTLPKEQEKRAVENMDRGDLSEWAHKIDPIAFRYRPGFADGGEEPRLGVSAQELEQSGPIGRLLVHEDPYGIKRVDYGQLALMMAVANQRDNRKGE